MDVRHARIQRFESEQFRGTFFLFVSLSLLESLDEREPRLDLEVGEHLSSSSSSLSLSLSFKRVIFWRSSHLSFDHRFRLRLTVNISFITYVIIINNNLLINRRQTRVSRSSLGETAS